jgi:hypothetical protein
VTTVFQPRPLPPPVARAVRARLREAHRSRPFSTADPRDTVRRVAGLLADLPVETTVCRGGLDLRGMEVDHVWIALERRRGDDRQPRKGRGPLVTAASNAPAGRRLVAAYVVDAAFPLYEQEFVATLRSFVVGEADADDLEAAAAAAGVEARVLGEFPPPMRYVGDPVWGHRD